MSLGWNEEIKKELGACGEEVYIGHNVMFADPSRVFLSDRVRIDPFTYISCGLVIKSDTQICTHVVIGGGKGHTVYLAGWNFIGYGSKLFCASEDYSGKYGPVNEFWGNNKIYRGDISFGKYSGIASDVIVMPGVGIPEGVTIGAQSFVYETKQMPYAWGVYIGNPLKYHKIRTKIGVLNAIDRWKNV